MRNGDRTDHHYHRNALRWMGVGVEFAIVVGVFSYIGHLLDNHYGNEGPWLLIAGFFVGFLLMLYWLLKSARDQDSRD